MTLANQKCPRCVGDDEAVLPRLRHRKAMTNQDDLVDLSYAGGTTGQLSKALSTAPGEKEKKTEDCIISLLYKMTTTKNNE